MSLWSIAEGLLEIALENTGLGGRDVTLTAPDGTSQPLTGSGRTASVALRISSIYGAGFTELPRRISGKTTPPWRVDYVGDDGLTYNWSVQSTMPDRSAGVIVLMLEEYTP